MTSAIFAIFALLAPVHAASNEVSLELGSFGAPDPQWSMVSYSDQLSSQGIRGGIAVHDRFSIVGSWHRSSHGGVVTVIDSNTYDEVGEFNLAVDINQFAIGPKFEWELWSWMHPYATTQATLFTGRLRIDDDPSEADNPNQFKYAGIAPGGVAAVGVDLIPLFRKRKVKVATHLEMGYGQTTAMRFEDDTQKGEPVAMGDLKFSGYYMRWGVGVRF